MGEAEDARSVTTSAPLLLSLLRLQRMAMERPNILFVVLDTARADIVQTMSREGELPGIEKFTDVGTDYERAFTNAPWTLPSHASMFTGQRSSDHGAHAGNKHLDPPVPTISELLSEAGYTTVGISCNSWVSGEFGFDRGFDNLSMKWDRLWNGGDLSKVARANGRDQLRHFAELLLSKQAPATVVNAVWATVAGGGNDFGAARTTSRTVRWLRSHEYDRPFFYFLNYIEPHLPYEPPEEYANRYTDHDGDRDVDQDPWEFIAGNTDMTDADFDVLEGLYRAELAYLDSHLERLYDELEREELLDSTAIIIVGDHGENIGDHGLMDHQYSLHESLLHVPLVVHYPGQSEPTSVSGLVEVRDLYPTVASLADVERPDDETVSSVDLSTGATREAVFAEYRYPQPDMDSLRESVSELVPQYTRLDRTLRAIRTPEWKLIEAEDGDVRLFRAGDESTSLETEYPDVSERLRVRMDTNDIALQRGQKQSVDVSDRTRARLDDLGYI